ncbi:MAG: rod-binding protein [Nitrospinae bacterium]|nr:rod-binding protein [Nitrospinota bacterium]
MAVDKGLEQIKKSAAGDAPGGNAASPLDKKTDGKLKSLAKQFESLLVFQMMTAMRETLPKSDLLGSFSGDMYQSMQDETLANEMTKNKGIGLADMIYRQLVRLDEKARAGERPGAEAPGGAAAMTPARSPESKSPIAPLWQRGEGGVLQGGEFSALRPRVDAGTSAAIRRPDSASPKAVKNYEVAP